MGSQVVAGRIVFLRGLGGSVDGVAVTGHLGSGEQMGFLTGPGAEREPGPGIEVGGHTTA